MSAECKIAIGVAELRTHPGGSAVAVEVVDLVLISFYSFHNYIELRCKGAGCCLHPLLRR